jgi:hypothetical protein
VKLTRKHRQVLAILAVTTALCADQVSVAAPSLRPQVAEFAGRIVTRLTQSFGRTVADAARVAPRQQVMTARTNPRAPVAPVVTTSLSHQPLSPFQFRLPPPTL